MFSAEDYQDEIQATTTYLKEDGRLVIGGRIQRTEASDGFFSGLYDNDEEIGS